jgi:hypothetical protein
MPLLMKLTFSGLAGGGDPGNIEHRIIRRAPRIARKNHLERALRLGSLRFPFAGAVDPGLPLARLPRGLLAVTPRSHEDVALRSRRVKCAIPGVTAPTTCIRSAKLGAVARAGVATPESFQTAG